MKKAFVILPLFIFMVAAILVGCSQTYTIRFNTNSEVVVAEIKVSDDADIVLPKDPVRDGYNFEGWYIDESLTTPLSLSYIKDNKDNLKSKIIYVYAKWSPKTITVTLDYGINKEYLSSNLIDEIDLVYGTEIYGNLPRPYANGYIFKGWFTEPNGKGELIEQTSKLSNSKSHNLYAYWVAQDGILLFDSKLGGTSYITSEDKTSIKFNLDVLSSSVNLEMFYGGVYVENNSVTITKGSYGSPAEDYYVTDMSFQYQSSTCKLAFKLEGTTITPYIVRADITDMAIPMAGSGYTYETNFRTVDLQDGCVYVPGYNQCVGIVKDGEDIRLQVYDRVGAINSNGMYDCTLLTGTQIGDDIIENELNIMIAVEDGKAIGYVMENGVLAQKYEFVKNVDGSYKLNSTTNLRIANDIIIGNGIDITTEYDNGYYTISILDENGKAKGSFVLSVATSGIINPDYDDDNFFKFNYTVATVSNNNEFSFNNKIYVVAQRPFLVENVPILKYVIAEKSGDDLTVVYDQVLFRDNNDYFFKLSDDKKSVEIYKLGAILYFDELLITENNIYSYEAIKSSLLASIGMDNITRRYNYGDTIGRLPTPDIPQGMEFVGWYSIGENGKKYETGSIFDAEGALLLEPRFVPITVTLELEVNNKFSQQPKGEMKFDYGSIVNINELPKYSVTGYTLIGWNTDSTALTGLTTNFVIYENTKLYAIWQEVKDSAYTTYLYSDSSSLWTKTKITDIADGINTIKVNDNQFEIDGVTYILDTTAGTITNSVDDTTIVTSITDKNTSSYKQLVFNIGGDIYVYIDGFMIKAPSKDGYTFSYWTNTSTSVIVKSVYDFNTTKTKDVVLYAYFRTNRINVEYNVDNSAYKSLQLAYNNFAISTTVANPQKEGYKFVGWTYNIDEDSYIIVDEKDTIESIMSQYGYSSNLVLVARFIEDDAKLEFVFNYKGEEVYRKSIGFGNILGYIEMPDVNGGYSLGWFTTINGQEYQITKDTVWDKNSPWGIISTTINVELKTTLRLYPVVIRPNKGTSTNIVVGDYAIYGQMYYPNISEIASQFEREGYQFAGLNTKADGTGIAINDDNGIVVNGALNLYIQWEPLKQMIYFADSITGVRYEGLEREIGYNESVGTFDYITVPGIGFAGWGVKIQTGAEGNIKESCVPITENYKFSTYNAVQTLYALWDEKNYYVRFLDDLEGGIDLGSTYFSKKVPMNISDYILFKPIIDPTKEDFVFDGWVDALGQPFEFGQKVTGDTYIYATWKRINILLDQCVGESESQMLRQPVAVGDELGQLPTPTREGYEFSGWYTEPNGAGLKVTEDTIWDGVTERIYAFWTPIIDDTI